MTKTFYTTLLTLFCIHSSLAQPLWTRIYGSPEVSHFYNICESNDGGYLAVGITTDWGAAMNGTAENYNIFLVKTDSAGNMEWQKTFGGSQFEQATDIVQVPSGDIFILGNIAGVSTQNDIFLLKLDVNGNEVWFNTYGGVNKDYAGGIVAVGNGVVVTGSKNGTGYVGAGSDVWLFKVNNGGGVVWDKTIGTANKERGRGICKIHDGGFMIAGQRGVVDDWTGYAIRTNSLGDTLWTRIIDSVGVADHDDGGFLACTELLGNTMVAFVGVAPNSTWGKLCAVTTDLSGNIYHQYISWALADAAKKVVPLNDGGFIVTGNYANYGGVAALYRFDEFGGYMWTTRYFGMSGQSYYSYSYAGGALPTSDGGFVLAGGSSLFSDEWDDYRPILMKVSSQGISGTGGGVSPSITPADTFCSGSSAIVSVPDVFDHYQWFWNTAQNHVTWLPNTDTSAISVDSSRSYRCMMWNDNGEHTLSNIAAVTVSHMPDTVITLVGNISYCPSNITLRVKNETGTTYNWMLNGSPLGINSFQHSPSISGSYSVQISNPCTTLTTPPVQITVGQPILDPGPDTVHVTYYIGANYPCYSPLLLIPSQGNSTYSWFHNGNQTTGTSNSYTPTQPGYYYLVVQNNCGTTFSDTTWVVYDTVHTQLTVSNEYTLTGCANHSLSLSVAGSFFYSAMNYDWYKNGLWITGGAGPSYRQFSPGYSTTGIDVGYFYCIITDTCGPNTFQHRTDSVYYVEEASSQSISVVGGGSPISCNGSPITIMVSQTSATYQWYQDTVPIASATQQQYTVTTSGLYKCKITRPCGTYFSTPITISVGFPTPAIISSTAAICRTSVDTVKVRLEQFELWYFCTYQWRLNGINITGPGSTNNYYETKIPGQYDCVLTYACTTVTTNSITLNDFLLPREITPDYYGKICPGGTLDLHAPPGYTYQWYEDQFGPDLLIPGATDSIYAADSTSYYFVNISNGQCFAKSEYEHPTWQTPPAPNFIMPITPPVSCGSSSVMLQANQRYDFTYQWNLNGLPIPGANAVQYLSSGIGNFSVEITDSANCSTVSAPLSTDNQSLNNISLSIPPSSFQCIGDTVAIVVIGNYQSYQWYYNNVVIPGATTNTITTDSSGYYSVLVTDTSGCNGTTGSLLNFTNPPGVSSITSSPASCMGANGGLYVTFNTAVGVSWSGPSYIDYSPLTTWVIESSLLPGWYYFTYSLPGANCTFTDSVEVQGFTSLPVQIDAGTGTICQGVSIDAGVGYPQYLWSTGQTSFSIMPQSTGLYILTVTNPSLGCSGTDSVFVTVIPAPVVDIQTAGPPVVCNGVPIQLDAGSGFSQYHWSTGQTTQSITVLSNGTFIVTVTDGTTGCTDKDTIVVTASASPVIGTNPSGTASICQGDSVTIQVTNGFPLYLWSNGATIPSITVNSAGTYVVTVSYAGGACPVQDSVTVTVNPLPVLTVTAMGPTSFCIGDSVLLTSSGSPGSYQWYRYFIPIAGATASSKYATARGVYKCLVTDANGCSSYSNPISVYTPCQPPQDPIEKTTSETLLENAMVIYPNPGHGLFEILFSQDFILTDFKVFDVSGRLVMDKSGISEIDLNIFRLDLTFSKSGVYYLQVTDENETVHRARIVKL